MSFYPALKICLKQKVKAIKHLIMNLNGLKADVDTIFLAMEKALSAIIQSDNSTILTKNSVPALCKSILSVGKSSHINQLFSFLPFSTSFKFVQKHELGSFARLSPNVDETVYLKKIPVSSMGMTHFIRLWTTLCTSPKSRHCAFRRNIFKYI